VVVPGYDARHADHAVREAATSVTFFSCRPNVQNCAVPQFERPGLLTWLSRRVSVSDMLRGMHFRKRGLQRKETSHFNGGSHVRSEASQALGDVGVTGSADEVSAGDGG
jgi:hypothetical protein